MYMNSSGEGNGIKMLRMKHKGIEINFQNLVNRQMINYEAGTEELKMLSLEFQDIQEVDSLINALEVFKNTCQLYAGRWNKI